jgi:hypothetical protein
MESDIIGYKMRDGSNIYFIDRKWLLFIPDKEGNEYSEHVASFHTSVEAFEAWKSRVDGDELQRKQIELEKTIEDEFRVHNRVKELEKEIDTIRGKEIENSIVES